VLLHCGMEIYLIRHTTPAVTYGTCYGFTDLDVAASFPEEAARAKQLLPAHSLEVYSSPLIRCSKLATYLFGTPFKTDPRLKELNFGEWEMQRWNDLGENALQNWMNDYVHARVPGGESYQDLYDRSTAAFLEIVGAGKDAAIVAHGGVIRAIIAYATQTPLEKSFDIRVEYGRVSKLVVTPDEITVSFFNQ
jgi:alpha-ribazole phosphatase